MPADSVTASSPRPSAGSLERLLAHLGWASFFVVLLVAYLPAYRGQFLWDDNVHLTANNCIVGPLGFGDIWFSSEANYFPLTISNLWLQHALWGLNPLPYHVVTVLLHAASALLLWKVLQRLGARGAWLGAMLWALHPVQVESVAWISETKNTQSALLFLASTLFFLRWAQPAGGNAGGGDRRGPARFYLLALLLAAMAILSKASTVMLPAALALCWCWSARRWRWSYMLWLAPFLALTFAASAWTIWEQQFHSGAVGVEWSRTLPERIASAGRVPWFYLGKLLWPHPLVFIYPRWTVDATRAAAFLPAALAGATLLLLWWRRHGPLRPLWFAGAFFAALIFPVLGLFNVYFFRYSYVGDHLQYLASMAPLALLGAGLATLGGRLAPPRARFASAAGALLLALAVLTCRQTRMYASDETLWRATLAENPDCWMARNNLGLLLLDTGRAAEALGHQQEALRLHPGDAEQENNLGLALFLNGRTEEAVPHYERALRLLPGYDKAHGNLGNALASLGRPADAIPHFLQALAGRPDDATTECNFGNALFAAGRPDEAIAHLQAALRLQPAFPEAEYNLGNVLRGTGRAEQSVAHFRAAVRLKPDYMFAHGNLALVLQQAGRPAEAIPHFEAALRLSNDAVFTFHNLRLLANALEAVGRPQDAATRYEQALQLDPGFDDGRARLEALRAAPPAAGR